MRCSYAPQLLLVLGLLALSGPLALEGHAKDKEKERSRFLTVTEFLPTPEGGIDFETIDLLSYNPEPLPEPATIRDLRWGMSLAEVEDIESRKPGSTLFETTSDISTWYASALGKPCVLVYEFYSGKLDGIYIQFDEEFDPRSKEDGKTGVDRILEEFDRVSRGLSDVYGEPTEEALIWTDPELRGNPKKRHLALETGAVRPGSAWQCEETNILLMTTTVTHEKLKTGSYYSPGTGGGGSISLYDYTDYFDNQVLHIIYTSPEALKRQERMDEDPEGETPMLEGGV